MSQKRDDAAAVESQTDHTIPSGHGLDLDALPALVGEGWLLADWDATGDRPRVVIDDADENLTLKFHVGYQSPLEELPSYNANHVQERGETGNSGHGKTLLAGDFYLDWRRTNRKWDGRQWTGGFIEVRARPRPDAPQSTTLVVDAVDVIERKADAKGRVTVGADYAGQEVRVAVLDPADGDESDENGESDDA